MKTNFYIPTRMLSGKGCVKQEGKRLLALGKKCLIVTGASSAKKSGAFDDVIAVLNEQCIAYTVYDQICQNPTVASCIEAGRIAANEGAQFIVGIGGGSPLDAAKAIAVIAANPTYEQTQLYSLQWENKPLPIVAIGTTAGTGSEVTPVSVLTTPNGLKKSFRADSLFPTLSFGDPSYTLSMPDCFTRSTAADAMAHALESYFNRTANAASMLFAAGCVKTLIAPLSKLAKDGTESLTYDDREDIYNASIYAGMAISITGTALPHAVGYFLSERHGVAHGTACAIFLPTFLRHSRACMPELAQRFYNEIGIEEDDLIALLEKISPKCDAHVTKEEIAELEKRWENNGSLLKTWGEITPETVSAILEELFC